MARNINMVFSHYLYGFRVYPMSLNPGAVNFGFVAREVAEVPFGYLAAATVAGT